MKSWISAGLVKCTDVVVAVGGVVLCSCFLFPVSEASSIAVGGIGDCTHSEASMPNCKKHPDAEIGQRCLGKYIALSHLSGNTPDHAYGDKANVCLENNCESARKPKSVPCTIPAPGGPQ